MAGAAVNSVGLVVAGEKSVRAGTAEETVARVASHKMVGSVTAIQSVLATSPIQLIIPWATV